MTNHRFSRIAFSLASLSLLAAACAAPGDSPKAESQPTSEPAAPSGDAAAALPSALRERAQAHLAVAFHAGLAPEWNNATLGEVRPIQRPDVDGIAYYEVAVLNGIDPAGYIVLSTGPHDFPIVQWNSRGERPTEHVRIRAMDAGVTIARYYRFDLGYAAETADGELAAGDESFEESFRIISDTQATARHAAWQETKANFAKSADTYLTKLRAEATAAWNPLAKGKRVEFGQAYGNNNTACSINDWTATPHWNQISPLEAPSTRTWSSGCGPTAWAIAIGWADIQADEGDPKWVNYKGLYREEGSTSIYAKDSRAPLAWDWGPKVMTDMISKALGTFQKGNAGSTRVIDMSHITDYLYTDGMNGSVIATTFDWGGGDYDSLRDRATYHICNDQSPAVMGIANGTHYAVGTGYLYSSNSPMFYLNMGFGGQSDGWYSGGVNFAGTITPRGGSAVVTPAPSTGIEVSLATYGQSCRNEATMPPFLGNATTKVAAACNHAMSCSYPINWRDLGDPAPGCKKEFTVSYRCAGSPTELQASVPAEASGQTVYLSCPTIHVQQATYGANCGVPAGNVTPWAASNCNGRTQCSPKVDYHVVGDPAPGCAKDFKMTYDCGGAAKTVTLPPEAGFGSVLAASCP